MAPSYRPPLSISELHLAVVKVIYRRAVDPQASDFEGRDWWARVVEDVQGVVLAGSVAEAAAVIQDWHFLPGDTPDGIAQRIRQEAGKVAAERKTAGTRVHRGSENCSG